MTRPSSDAASHIGSRSENQDGWARWHRGSHGTFFAVADGLGGHRDGRDAAGFALEAAADSFRDAPTDPAEAAHHAVVTAARAVRAERELRGNDMASTLVALVFKEDRIGWAWCGDSRLYRLRDEMIERLTNDHSAAMVQLPLEQRAIADVRGDRSRNRLISVLGEEEPLIEQRSDELLQGDRFLLCSDGFWEGSSRAEIATALAQGTSARAMVDAVLAKRHEGQDNLTVLVVSYP